MKREFPAVADLIPHDADMVLLSEVLEHGEAGTVCAIEVGSGPLVGSDGRVGAWVGIEYMSQCVAAHGGLLAHAANERPRIGLLLGTRRIRLLQGYYRAGQKIIARAVPVWGRTVGLVAFDCTLECANSGELLAESRLKCFVGEDGMFEKPEDSK
ncbi:MAG: hypothetical protein GY944_04340 [bacterium]|nr:hypothetical protein [bacterium]